MIDLKALRRVANDGNPKDRVTVNRAWLREVLAELEAKKSTYNSKVDDVLKKVFGK